MEKIFKIFLIIFCLTFETSTATEIQKGGIEHVELSFEQAYELMLENNNSLKAYNELINKSKYEKRSAIGQFFPKVGLNATYIHFSDDMTLNSSVTVPAGVPVLGGATMTADTLIQDKNVFTFGGSAVWTIFTGGKLLSNHAAARAKLEASNEKYREIKDNLTLELVKRYYGLRLARDIVNVRKQVADGMEQHLKDAKLLEKEGIISKSERLHAEVAYSNAMRDYKTSLRDANVIEEGLKTLIKAKEANLKDVYVEPTSLLFVYNNSTIDLPAMKKNALDNNPQLKQLMSKKKMMNAKYHAQVANYSPTISLMAYDIAGASHLSQAVPRAGFGATANWLLFDGLSRYNNVRAADCERKMVDFEIEDAKFNLESLVIKQYQELMKNKEQYDSATKSVEDATEALRTTNLAFKEGFGTSLQVTDAQMMLSKVKIERLNSVYNYDVNLTDLLKTNGDTNSILTYIKTSKQEQF